jgi:hypothetical protein
VITSKQILEEYYSSVKTFMGYAEVFENPTTSDLLSLEKNFTSKMLDNVRYLANTETKIVYVWDANLALHKDIRKILKLPYEPEKAPYTMHGEANLTGGKIKFINAEIGNNISALKLKNVPNHRIKQIKKYLNLVFQYNWDWLDKYINGIGEYINKEREQLPHKQI